MPTKLTIPKTSELLETVRTPSELIDKYPNQTWVVQPKYDGSKCIFIPGKTGYIAVTGGGNQIECIPDYLEKLNQTLGQLPLSKQPVLEAEIAPTPWTQENKVKLNGNLYKVASLPFSISVHVFDAIPSEEFQQQATARTPFRQRIKQLEELKPILQSCGMDVSPSLTLTSEQVAEKMEAGIQRGKKEHRVMVDFNATTLAMEGLVIRNPDSVYQGGKRNPNAIKLKPFISLDLVVVAAGRKSNGMAALGCIDTKDPKQPYYLFTGLPKNIQSNPTALLGEIVEIEVLTTDDPKKGMGNPTYKSTRPDKNFTEEIDPKVVGIISEKLEKAGVACEVLNLGPDVT